MVVTSTKRSITRILFNFSRHGLSLVLGKQFRGEALTYLIKPRQSPKRLEHLGNVGATIERDTACHGISQHFHHHTDVSYAILTADKENSRAGDGDLM